MKTKVQELENDLKKTVKQKQINFLCISGSQLIQRLKRRRLLTTFSKVLDISLDGGLLSSSGVYGICGPPGGGKTQFCLQLAVNIQLPSFLWGCEKKAWYIDTQGGFTVNRCNHIAKCAAHHFNSVTQHRRNPSKIVYPNEINSQMFLNGILVTRLFDHHELLDLIMNMDSILTDPSSLDFFQQVNENTNTSRGLQHCATKREYCRNFFGIQMCRSSFTQNNPSAISSVFKDIGRVLNHISLCYDLVILVTNQVTTRREKKKFTTKKEKAMYLDASIQPCFRKSWEKMCSTTLFINLTETQTERQIHIYRQHIFKKQRRCSAKIQLLPEGIRDVEQIIKTPSKYFTC